MTDIVERLRSMTILGHARPEYAYANAIRELITEIERLRAALQHVLDNADHDSHRFTDIEMIKVVKAVLPSPPTQTIE